MAFPKLRSANNSAGGAGLPDLSLASADPRIGDLREQLAKLAKRQKECRDELGPILDRLRLSAHGILSSDVRNDFNPKAGDTVAMIRPTPGRGVIANSESLAHEKFGTPTVRQGVLAALKSAGRAAAPARRHDASRLCLRQRAGSALGLHFDLSRYGGMDFALFKR